jgi:hypothetical protein
VGEGPHARPTARGSAGVLPPRRKGAREATIPLPNGWWSVAGVPRGGRAQMDRCQVVEGEHAFPSVSLSRSRARAVILLHTRSLSSSSQRCTPARPLPAR